MRRVITATEGNILTNGEIYGTEIYLADGVDGAGFYEITLEEYKVILEGEDVTDEDYREALKEMGVRI